MKNSQGVEFSFIRPNIDVSDWFVPGFNAIKTTYETILKDYLSTVFGEKTESVNIRFYDLNKNINTNGSFQEYDPANGSGSGTTFSAVMCHSVNLYISGNEGDGSRIFSFYMYGQNNCCGAMTISDTRMPEKYMGRKLGKILQYLKEDIALLFNISLLTCTDVYNVRYIPGEDIPVEELKPYRPNTKLLLSTGWEVASKFYNRKSNNVVALFSKKVPLVKDVLKNVSMKISRAKEELIKIENVTVGCDPELFFRSKETKEFVPSFHVMRGDKYSPLPITDEGHNIQCDNVMAEYGIPASKTVEEFVKHNLLVQDYLKEMVAEPNDLELFIFPSAEFKENNLADPRAKAFGCDPDYDVYNEGKPNRVGVSKDGLRTAGKMSARLYSNI